MTKTNKATAQAAALPTLLTEGALTGLINSVIANARKGEGELHIAAYQAIAYAKATNNANPLARLCNELPNSARADALMAWAKAFAPVQFHQAKDKDGNKLMTDDQRKMVVVRLVKGRVDADYKLAEAYATPFFQFKKPNVAGQVELDVVHTISMFIKKIEKAMGKGGDAAQQEKLRAQLNLATTALVAIKA